MARTIQVQYDAGNMQSLMRGFAGAAERGVALAADRVRSVSLERVPFKDSPLSESVRVDVSATAEGADAVIGYYEAYAKYQHENALIHLNGRQDHYLSSAITDERANVYKIMATQVKVLLS